MTVNIKMVVDVNDTAADGRLIETWEIEGHIKDALTEWTGNDVKFFAVDVIECEKNSTLTNKQEAQL